MRLDLVATFRTEAGEAAGLLKVMANECRLLVLCHLSVSGELSVGQLAERVGLSQSALSQHLAKLRQEGLVATNKVQQTVFYRLCDPRAEQLLALLHQLFCPDLTNQPLRDNPDVGDRSRRTRSRQSTRRTS